MQEIGIDFSDHKPKSLRKYCGEEMINYLIIVWDRVINSCPRVWPGPFDENRLYWPFDDSASAVGTEEGRMKKF